MLNACLLSLGPGVYGSGLSAVNISSPFQKRVCSRPEFAKPLSQVAQQYSSTVLRTISA